MINKVKLSIIIPVYNAEKYLSRCIESILNQTYKEIEILLIDDGSTDGSHEICDMYAQKYDNVLVIHKTNGGVSSARNMGLDNARGEYVAFIDADDYVSDNLYQDLINKIKVSDAEIAVCSVYRVDSNGNKVLITQNHQEISDNMMLKIMSGFGEWIWNKVYKKDIIGELRFDTDLSFGEDVYWLSQYCLKCKKSIYSTESSYLYFVNDDSACRNVLSKDKMVRKYNMERKSHLKIFEVYKKANKEAIVEFEHFMLSINIQNFIRLVKGGWVEKEHIKEVKSLCREHLLGLFKSSTAYKMKLLGLLMSISPRTIMLIYLNK